MASCRFINGDSILSGLWQNVGATSFPKDLRCSPLQIALQLTRAVKYNRISMDGGMTSENVAILLGQCADVYSRLSTCNRAVKAILPLQKGGKD